LELQPAVGKQGHVVGPRGRAYVNDGMRRSRADELRAQAKRAAPAGSLDRAQATRSQRGMLLSQQQPFHRPVESSVADCRNIGLGRLSREQLLLRLPDCSQDRSLAGIVAKDSDAQIDLARIAVGAESRHDAENGVRYQPVEMLEHVYLLAAWLGQQEIEFTRAGRRDQGAEFTLRQRLIRSASRGVR